MGSPECRVWCALQNIAASKSPESKRKLELERRRHEVHLRFCAVLYWEQMRNGRYFVHEQPQAAASWQVPSMKRLAETPGVYKAVAHQCAYGLESEDKQGKGPAKKPTVFMTNSIKIHQRMSDKCPGCPRHVWLEERRARAAQRYPPRLCRALCQGTLDQAAMDARNLRGMECRHDGEVGSVDVVEHEEEEWVKYWDDLSGAELPRKLVEEARQEELDVIKAMGVWEKRPREECIQRTGRRPIKLRWVDVNKGIRQRRR